VLLGLLVAGLLCTVHWIFGSHLLDWRAALALIAVAASGLLLFTYHRRPSGGDLAWDGLNWLWTSDEAGETADSRALSIEVILDFQRLLVLKTIDNIGIECWVIAQRDGFPEKWLDFRRAIYCLRKAIPTPMSVDPTHPADTASVAASPHGKDKHAMRIAA
jgi:hypothetical protein